MPARIWSSPVLRFSRNLKGRDFIVGDIHGCMDQLRSAMAQVDFDRAKDRMFSVGDLVDRGPLSDQARALLSQSWFHACRGNHEDMILEIYDDGPAHPDLISYLVNSGNGVEWLADLAEEERLKHVAAFRRMPIAMEVETATGLVGIVHADVPRWTPWTVFTKMLEAQEKGAVNVALWSRERMEIAFREEVKDVEKVFIGHTPIERPNVLANVAAIDTGCVFGFRKRLDGYLTLVDIDITLDALRSAPIQKQKDPLVNVMLSWDLQPAAREEVFSELKP